MGEPLSTTLGAAALLAPLFTACKHLHHGYKLTRAFGEDFVLIQTRIDVQHARVQQFAKKQVRSLKGYERVNIGDENDPVVSVIIRCLATVKAQLETCNALMEQYHKKHNNDTSAKTGTDLIAANADPAASGATLTGSTTLPHSGSTVKPDKRSMMGTLRRKLHLTAGSEDVEAWIPSAQSESSILDSAQVKEVLEKQGQEANAMQISTPFSRRVPWAVVHRKKLLEALDLLSKFNTDLDSLLIPWPVERNVDLSPHSEEKHSTSRGFMLIRQTLLKLHKGLLRLNVGTGLHDSFHFSIQLRQDCDENREALVRNLDSSDRLREGSLVSNLQRHRGNDSINESTLFLAESALDTMPGKEATPSHSVVVNGTPAAGLQELDSFDIPLHIHQESSLRTPGTLEIWGLFRTSSSSTDYHVLFHDSSNQWSSTFNLVDILDGDRYRRHMSPAQVIELAKMILISYLYFLPIRDQLAINLRPAQYRYFRTPDEVSDIWDPDEPLVLRPWLTFGFGSPPQPPKLGGGSGVAKSQNASLIELGLMLYQVGAGVSIEYGAGKTGLIKAKTKAQKELHLVDDLAGIRLTDIIRSCLSPDVSSSAGLTSGGQKETNLVVDAISTLQEYATSLEGVISEVGAYGVVDQSNQANNGSVAGASESQNQLDDASPVLASEVLTPPVVISQRKV